MALRSRLVRNNTFQKLHLGWSSASFVSTFLAKDYEDELVERVRTKAQGESETLHILSELSV